MRKIGVWGDSITRGAIDQEQGGWVSRLRNYIDATQDGKPEVFNLGINGEKVSDILERFEREYNELDKPDVVVIAIGLNDTSHKFHKGTGLDTFKQKYEALIQLAAQPATTVILVGLTNVLDDHPGKHGYSNQQVLQYNQVIKDLAVKHGLTFVELIGIINEKDLQKDGFHPEEAGHEKIYKQVAKALKI